MTDTDQDAPIPPVLLEYIKNPLAEEHTVEIFEDLHAVIDQHLIEIGRQRGSQESDEELVRSFEETFDKEVEIRRQRMKKDHGALLPYAFVSSNVKMEYLIKAGHPEYGPDRVPDAVIEIVQEFAEIVTYRAELEE